MAESWLGEHMTTEKAKGEREDVRIDRCRPVNHNLGQYREIHPYRSRGIRTLFTVLDQAIWNQRRMSAARLLSSTPYESLAFPLPGIVREQGVAAIDA